MEDLSQRCDLHSTLREQERERRRIRDRERRQSMTEEQRQMHLARRRKNYQLRRQKIKHLEVGYQSAPKGTASSSDIGERFEEQGTPDTSKLGLECNDIIPAGIDHVLQKINIEQSRSGGMYFSNFTCYSPELYIFVSFKISGHQYLFYTFSATLFNRHRISGIWFSNAP